MTISHGMLKLPAPCIILPECKYLKLLNLIFNHNVPRNFRILSYLPLSHIAGCMVDIHAPMYQAGTTYFADKNVLKSTLLDNLQWCKPTVFFGVPRVYEKVNLIYEF